MGFFTDPSCEIRPVDPGNVSSGVFGYMNKQDETNFNYMMRQYSIGLLVLYTATLVSHDVNKAESHIEPL